ncbi:response regulator [Paenibacillus sp. J5C_2022]|uniref:response regulator n=1 Tax=Paenibacillus sp. J5C2022 TaxID=2977129 RepID=UPI0021D16A74|nr:response regulator [Paenibacillus sp. J5C2022]MCU6711445.1 response regulator [Paenibacillus sp. J5C2022]
MIRAFLVDDEMHALQLLEYFLKTIGDVDIVGQAGNGPEALTMLQACKPDVLFLDIEMPGMNGIELAEVIRNEYPGLPIIFVTAYDQYAVAAFEQEAIDYLLKPLELPRLQKTMARVRRELARNAESSIDEAVPQSNRKLTIRLLGAFYAGAEGVGEIKWRTAKERELLAFLAAHSSMRVHRDTIIEQLWPEEHYQKAKIYLHTCISLLRKHFKQLGFEQILNYEQERYSLDPDKLDNDVIVFRRLIQQLTTDSSGSFSYAEAKTALSAYRGRLLQEEDYAWAHAEAEWLDKSACQLRMLLSEQYMKQSAYDKVIKLAQETIAYSPYDEEAYRLLMNAHHAMGNNVQVMQVYRELADKLDEMQIRPSQVTSELYSRICRI